MIDVQPNIMTTASNLLFLPNNPKDRVYLIQASDGRIGYVGDEMRRDNILSSLRSEGLTCNWIRLTRRLDK